jgi:hypothetical protein
LTAVPNRSLEGIQTLASDRRPPLLPVLRYALSLMAGRPPRSRAQRRADRALIAAYHEAQLANLLERVRAGFAAYDAGQLDAFGLDDIIHRYKRAASKLWSFCFGTGGQVEMAVRTLEWLRADGNEPDWWEEADPSRDRRR